MNHYLYGTDLLTDDVLGEVESLVWETPVVDDFGAHFGYPVVVGSDWYYSLTELQKLMTDLRVDLTNLAKDLAAPGAIDRFGYSSAQQVQAFINEVQKYLSGTPMSMIDPTSSKTVGDALVEYRQRAQTWRYKIDASGVTVTPSPAAPPQRRRDDPRDIDDAQKAAEAWGFKEYALVGVLGLGVIGALAYVGKHWILGR
jgi:hypothetical protein